MPFMPCSRLPCTEDEVRRALWCSPEPAGADPCTGLSRNPSASDPGDVPAIRHSACVLTHVSKAAAWILCAKSLGGSLYLLSLALSDSSYMQVCVPACLMDIRLCVAEKCQLLATG